MALSLISTEGLPYLLAFTTGPTKALVEAKHRVMIIEEHSNRNIVLEEERVVTNTKDAEISMLHWLYQ